MNGCKGVKRVKRERAVVAMSGGVDSSVAAALLVEQGYEVVGVTMQIWPEEGPLLEARQGGCCSLGAVEDARRVAGRLGIPYYVVNLRDVFADRVIRDFVEEYVRGRTPNPCVACNRWIKFDALLRRARELDADFLATGHYARVRHDPERGRWVLARPADRRKDQTYVLYCMTQEQLAFTRFPLGDLTKAEVRRIAARLSLPVADKPESQEICFVPDGGHGAFVAARAPGRVAPGPILTRRGEVVGTHRGLPYYTVGQRRGLGLAASRPLYVLEIDPARNALIVGDPEEGLAAEAEVSDVNLILMDWSELAARPEGVRADVQVRYRSDPSPARVIPLDAAARRVRVRFDTPRPALTPGQAAVFYQGDLVLGGGTIEPDERTRSPGRGGA